jgi:hypothetical protein
VVHDRGHRDDPPPVREGLKGELLAHYLLLHDEAGAPADLVVYDLLGVVENVLMRH